MGNRPSAATGVQRLAGGDAPPRRRRQSKSKFLGLLSFGGGGKILATMLALGVASATVMFGSYAAWTDQTTNPGNSVTAGALDITNSKDAAAVFAVTGVAPGDSGSDTVVVGDAGASGIVDFQLFLTQNNLSASAGNIEANLRLSIYDQTRNWCYYPVSASGACASLGAWDGSATINNLQLMNAAGGALWDSTTDEQHTFQLDWALDAASDTDDQNQVGSFDLIWDATQ